MPTKDRLARRKKWSESYRIESNGGESFTEFKRRLRKLKKEGLV